MFKKIWVWLKNDLGNTRFELLLKIFVNVFIIGQAVTDIIISFYNFNINSEAMSYKMELGIWMLLCVWIWNIWYLEFKSSQKIIKAYREYNDELFNAYKMAVDLLKEIESKIKSDGETK